MDPQLLQGLRDAKQLLDDGILTQEEFLEQKTILLRTFQPSRIGGIPAQPVSSVPNRPDSAAAAVAAEEEKEKQTENEKEKEEKATAAAAAVAEEKKKKQREKEKDKEMEKTVAAVEVAAAVEKKREAAAAAGFCEAGGASKKTESVAAAPGEYRCGCVCMGVCVGVGERKRGSKNQRTTLTNLILMSHFLMRVCFSLFFVLRVFPCATASELRARAGMQSGLPNCHFWTFARTFYLIVRAIVSNLTALIPRRFSK